MELEKGQSYDEALTAGSDEEVDIVIGNTDDERSIAPLSQCEEFAPPGTSLSTTRSVVLHNWVAQWPR